LQWKTGPAGLIYSAKISDSLLLQLNKSDFT